MSNCGKLFQMTIKGNTYYPYLTRSYYNTSIKMKFFDLEQYFTISAKCIPWYYLTFLRDTLTKGLLHAHVIYVK